MKDFSWFCFALFSSVFVLISSDDSCVDPKAKCVIRSMDLVFMELDPGAWDNKTSWQIVLSEFYTEDMVYDTNYTPNEDLNNSTDLGMWIDKEVIPYFVAFGNVTFNQLIFASEEETATTTTYAKTRWRGDIGTVPGSDKFGQETTHRIYDFYMMRGDKICYNWMLLDMVEIMYEAGFRVLPKSELREGWVSPPAAMDGIPAPISRLVNPIDGPSAKILVEEALLHDIIYGSEPSSLWSDSMDWYGPFGIGYAPNKQDYEQFFLKPFREAFSERNIEINILTCEGSYCGVNGFIHGVHSGPWLGEEATFLPVKIRFGFHYRVDLQHGAIPEGYALLDIPGAFIQMGVDLYSRLTPQYSVTD